MNGPAWTGASSRPQPDEGAPDGALASALAAWQANPQPDEEAGVQAALVGARLLLPIVPLPAEDGDAGAPPREMSRPTLIGQDGRAAVPAFSSVDSLAAWRSDARPVPASGRDVLLAASEEGAAVVLDIAGPVTYVVQDEALTRLAAGVIRLSDSEVVSEAIAGHQVEGGLTQVNGLDSAPAGFRDALAGVLAGEPLIAEAYLLAPEEGPEASELAVGLVLSADVNPTQLVALVRRLADALAAAPHVPRSLDLAVLTEAQRSAARALGPPVSAARPDRV